MERFQEEELMLSLTLEKTQGEQTASAPSQGTSCEGSPGPGGRRQGREQA